MTQGLRDAGFDVVAAVEIDELAVATYELNHPATRVVPEDIRKVDAARLKRAVLGDRRLDLLAACPPCQGFSSVRTRRQKSSEKDKRNRLVRQVLRFVDAFEPRAVLFENVPALKDDWRFAVLRTGLKKRGYTVTYGVEDAADYGVPQRRKRLILCAVSAGLALRKPVHARRRVTVRDAIGGLPLVGESGDPLHDLVEKRTTRIEEFIAAVPKNGGGRHAIGDERQLACHRRSDGFYDVYGRMPWDGVAPTMTTGCINPSKGRFLHPEFDRAVTPREAALLQSFPPKYRFSLARGKYRVAEMIGNALPPKFVKAHANALRESLIASTKH